MMKTKQKKCKNDSRKDLDRKISYKRLRCFWEESEFQGTKIWYIVRIYNDTAIEKKKRTQSE